MAAVIGSLRAELTASIAQFQQDMGKAADSVKQIAGEMTKAGNDFRKVGSQLQGVGLGLTKAITLPLVAVGAAAFKVGTDFEDAFAGVKKTVTGSVGELDQISNAFRDMAKVIPTSATELAKIGEIAGQLGVSKENIVAFTKTISDISTATHLTADEAATSFARLAIVMKVPQDQFESLGSAVYSLGNFGSSTEQEMLSMAQRIAGAGATVGLTAGQVLGLSNALSSVGVEAEAGGTAMSKILIKMAEAAHDGGKKLEEFAKIAGTSAEQFKTQFQTDAGGAVVSFVQGLGRIQSSGGDLLGTIQDLGFEEVRLRNATLLMANAGTLVADSVDLGTKAFADHTAFLAAVQERYKTTTNQLKILGNQIADVGITLFTSLKPAIETGIHLVQSMLPYIDMLAKAFGSLPGGVQLTIIGFLGVAAALGPAIWFAGQMVSSLSALTLAFGKGGIATRALITGIGLAKDALGGFRTALDAGSFAKWTASLETSGGFIGKFGASLATLVSTGLGPLTGLLSSVGGAFVALVNPVTLTIAAVAGVGLAIIALTGHWDDFKAAVGTAIQVVKDIGTVLWWLAKEVIGDLVSGLASLAKWVGSGIVDGFNVLVSVAKAVGSQFLELASAIGGPVINAFKAVGNSAWFQSATESIKGLWEATKDLAASGVQSLHDYATAVRDMAKDIEIGFNQANKGLDDYRKSITDRAIPTAAMEIGSAMALLKTQLAGVGKSGGSGFDDLTASLKAARAELAALSSRELSALTEAVKSGAFTMKELHDETGLSETALKIFQDRIRDNAKEMKQATSIFDDYKKKVGELSVGLSEALKFDVPTEFIKRQFGSTIQDVVDQANILGKKLPQIIQDAFLKITIKDATDHLLKEFEKFTEQMNAQVKADLEKTNQAVIKTLGITIDAQQAASDSAAQFSIHGLQNQIKNIESVTGETKRSIELRKQLYAEEYQFQVTLIQREAQVKKDALDKTDQYYNMALDAINLATSSKMGQASQAYQQKLTEMQLATKKWTGILDELSGAFSQMAQISDGAFGGVAKEIGTVISALSLATKAAKSFRIASASGDKAGQVAAIAGGISAVAQATSSKNKVSAVAGGALTGATVGSIIPGLGSAAGAGIGALVGFIRSIHKGPAEKAAIDVGRDFGINISEGLAKELGDLGKNIGRQAAGIFDLDKIIAEGGGLRSDNIKAYTSKLRDTFVLVKQGALTAADGAVVLDKNFANFANEFLSNGPLISKELVDIVKLTDDLGVSSKAVGEFIKGQVEGSIVPGLHAFATASGDASKALADNQQKLKDLNAQLASASPGPDQEKLKKDIAEVTAAIAKEQGVIAATAITSQGAADALSASVAVAFAEMMKLGTPITEIVSKLEPVVISLGQQFEAAGFSGGAAFENIKALVALAADEIAGPAIQAVTGLSQTMAGLSNVGQLNQQTFTGLTDQIAATFNSLITQGYNGGQVLSLLQQPLQTIWELSTEFGYSVDESTKALLDQGLAAGVVGERFKGPQQQMIDALKETNSILGSIAQSLGAALPTAAQIGAKGIQAAFAQVNPKINVDIKYNDPGFKPNVSSASTGGLVTPYGVQQFAEGGFVQQLTGGHLQHFAKGGIVHRVGGDNSVQHFSDGGIVQRFSNLIQHFSEGGTVQRIGGLVQHFIGGGVVKDFSNLIQHFADGGIVQQFGGDKNVQHLANGGVVQNVSSRIQHFTEGGIVQHFGGDTHVQHLAGGGLVQQIFHPKGTDTVPAMLTPGEVVLNKAQQETVSSALSAPAGAVASSAADMTGPIHAIAAASQAAGASITTAMSGAAQSITAVASDATGQFEEMAGQIRSFLDTAVQGLSEKLAGLPGAAKTAADGILSAFTNLGDQIGITVKYDDPGLTPKVSAAAIGGAVAPSGIQQLARGGVVRPRTSALVQMFAAGGVVHPVSGLTQYLSSGGTVQNVTDRLVQHFHEGGLIKKLTNTVTTQHLAEGGLVQRLQHLQHFAEGGIVQHFGGDKYVQQFADGGLVQYVAGGGAIQKLFQPKGTDTVPAMLTPGELVLTSDQQASISAALSAGPSSMLSGIDRGISDSHIGAVNQTVQAKTNQEPDQYVFNFSITAMDTTSIRDHVVKPGGIADLVIDSVSQGKRGRDARLRRGLALE